MSTEVESAKQRGELLTRAHRLLEIPALFELYQVAVDGGKRTPVSRFLEGVPYESVVDLGCGTGAWSYLTKKTYLGLDYSSSFIEGCRRRFRDDGRKRFEMGDLESIELNERFDLALMMSVLHHLSDHQAEAVLESLRGNATRLLVMDLIPMRGNPLSRLLYRLDRGDHIRSVDQQRRVLTGSGDWEVEREDSFYSYNRLYRHTLFLLQPKSDAGIRPSESFQLEHGSH
jgi:SAM-dependent methyltransferase